MDSCSNIGETTQSTSPTKPIQFGLIEIKREIIDDDPLSLSDKYDDYDFEPFHENVFRTLSINFDNNRDIAQVNDAYGKLEKCFIENNILNKNGVTKFTQKLPTTSHFLRYKDIDDAFVDVISETISKPQNTQGKIDLRHFKENIFPITFDDTSLSDNDESKISDSDFDGLGDLCIDESRSEDEVSEGEAEMISYVSKLLDENNISLDFDAENIRADSPHRLRSGNIFTENFNNSESDDETDCMPYNDSSSLENNVKDLRVVIKKLNPNISESDFTVFKPVKQTARKSTGGAVIKNHNNINAVSKESPKDASTSPESGSGGKDPNNVPSGFDKMTRSAKRDLERVLAESTANLVIKKTTELISEKIKELKSQEIEEPENLSEDEDKETDIVKTAEIVTNTIIEFLTKNKGKKLDKLAMDIKEDLVNKMNSIKFGQDSPNKVGSATSSTPATPEKLKVPVETKEDENLANPTVSTNEILEQPVVSPKKTTRESARQRASKKKSSRKSGGHRKVSVKPIAIVPPEVVTKEAIKCVETIIIDEEEDEAPRRPETRQSKQKQKETLVKPVVEKAPPLPPPVGVKRSMRLRQRLLSNKTDTTINENNVVKDMGDITSCIDGTTIPPIVDNPPTTIDTSLNEDTDLALSDSELSKIANDACEKFLAENELLAINSPQPDRKIMKASADSTTSENLGEFPLNFDGTVSDDTTDLSSNIIGEKTNTESTLEQLLINYKGIVDNLKESVTNLNTSDTNLHVPIVDKLDGSKTDETSKLVEVDHSLENKENLNVTKVPKKGRVSIAEVQPAKKKLSFDTSEDTTTEAVDENHSTPIVSDTCPSSKSADNDDRNLIDGVSSQVISDIITDIEKHNEKMTPRKIRRPKVDPIINNVEPHADSTSFLNYTMDDSFKLMIDEGSPTKESPRSSIDTPEEPEIVPRLTRAAKRRRILEENDEDVVTNGVHNEAIPKVAQVMPVVQMKKVEDVESSDAEKLTINIESEQKVATIAQENSNVDNKQCSKRLSNEEKIANLTRRDPRLINEKKIVTVALRDPRIRNKFPKVDEKPADTEAIPPEVKPKMVPEVKPKMVPEVKLKMMPEVKPKMMPEVKPKMVPEAKPKMVPEVKPKMVPEVRPKMTSEVKPTKVIPEVKPTKVLTEVKPIMQKAPEVVAAPTAIVKPAPLVHEVKPLVNEVKPLVNEEKLAKPQELVEKPEYSSRANVEHQKKKCNKKEVDKELLYKTPLSDLHDASNERSSYNERNMKLKRPIRNERDLKEDGPSTSQRYVTEVGPTTQQQQQQPRQLMDGAFKNTHQQQQQQQRYVEEMPSTSQRRVRVYDETGGDNRNGGDYNRSRMAPDEHYNREPTTYGENNYYKQGVNSNDRNYDEDERFFRAPNNDERYFNDLEREKYYQSFPTNRGHFEKEAYNNRRMQERNEIPDSECYSRREFFRRNKYSHDHDHFSSHNHFPNAREESTVFNYDYNNVHPEAFEQSAYPPVVMLPDPMYNEEEEFDQSYGNMETDSFSPPSSDLCPPPPLIRSPSPPPPMRHGGDNFCPSPPRIGVDNDMSPEYNNRSYNNWNYDRDERNSNNNGRGRYGGGSRDNRGDYNRRGGGGRIFGGGSSSSAGGGSDFRRSDDSPPRKRFFNNEPHHHQPPRGRPDDNRCVRRRRSPSWSPPRRWSRDRSMSPPPMHNATWRNSHSPPPRHYRDRPPLHKNYHRY